MTNLPFYRKPEVFRYVKHRPLQQMRRSDEKEIKCTLTHTKFFAWLDANCYQCKLYKDECRVSCKRNVKLEESILDEGHGTCPVNPCPDILKRVLKPAKPQKTQVDAAEATRLRRAGHNIANIARILKVSRYRLVKELSK